jgi:hypothetical protein
MRPAPALVLFCLFPGLGAAQAPAEPPNAPATAEVDARRLVLRYQGQVIFEATIAATEGSASLHTLTDSAGGRVTQVLMWTADGAGRLTMTGMVAGSPEAFAAESEPREDGLAARRVDIRPVERHHSS